MTSPPRASTKNKNVIIGGTIGGICAAAFIAGILVFAVKRNRKPSQVGAKRVELHGNNYKAEFDGENYRRELDVVNNRVELDAGEREGGGSSCAGERGEGNSSPRASERREGSGSSSTPTPSSTTSTTASTS